ncbi:MAG: efflux RND transporter periplasmic adaptor subunit [Terriglobales bacterium]
MPTESPISAARLTEFASSLLSQREVIPRARLTAEQVADIIPDSAVVVYVIIDQKNPVWTPKAMAGEIAMGAEEVEFQAGTLGAAADIKSTALFDATELSREDYAHLDVRRTVSSLAYVPFLIEDTFYGTIEIVTYDQPPTEVMLESATEIAGVALPSIRTALEYESERNTNLQSVMRVTQMYDLEKVFNSNLEMDDLLVTIANKFCEVLNVQAVNVWMVDGDAVKLVSRAGVDPTVEMDALQRPGDGIAGDVSDNGELVLISDAEDERLRKRNGDVEDGGVFSLLAAALMDRESLVGVVEAINRQDGLPFDEDDEFLLVNIAETASNALHNASLLLAERKLEILETLVTVSKEITSTLNMDGVLDTVVNGTKAVVPYDRAAVALEQRGKLQVKAVSGLDQIRLGDAEVAKLRDLLEWAVVSNDEIHIKQHGVDVEVDREETKTKFAEYFEETGMRAFFAIPLLDDAGRIGILSFESRDPDFLTDAHVEMIRILAAQTTVAPRNAELYKEVPFIGVIEPLMQRKKRFMAMEKRRRALMLTVTAAIILFLVFCPIPMRMVGDASVAPQGSAQIQPEVDGVVRSVSVHEGDAVRKGAVLAELDDWDYRSALAAAQAKYNGALAEMNRALAANDGTEAGVQRLQFDFWSSELERARERLEKTRLRSPIDGVVATPNVETMVGRHLAKGDTLAEVVNTSSAMVDVAIDQDDIAYLKPRAESSVKLESFPTKTFKGNVVIVSPKSEASGDNRVFFVRVSVPNPDGKIRSGMQGRGKVWAGWRPAGYVLLRRPLMWIWSKLWWWFGW